MMRFYSLFFEMMRLNPPPFPLPYHLHKYHTFSSSNRPPQLVWKPALQKIYCSSHYLKWHKTTEITKLAQSLQPWQPLLSCSIAQASTAVFCHFWSQRLHPTFISSCLLQADYCGLIIITIYFIYCCGSAVKTIGSNNCTAKCQANQQLTQV